MFEQFSQPREQQVRMTTPTPTLVGPPSECPALPNATVMEPISSPRISEENHLQPIIEEQRGGRCHGSHVSKGECPPMKLLPRRRVPALCSPSPVPGSDGVGLKDGDGRQNEPVHLTDTTFSTTTTRAQTRVVSTTPGTADFTVWHDTNDTNVVGESIPANVPPSPVGMDFEVSIMKGLSLESPAAVRPEPPKSIPAPPVFQREMGSSFSDYLSSPARSMHSSFSSYIPSPACNIKGSPPASLSRASAAGKKWSPSPRKARLKVLSQNTPRKGTSPMSAKRYHRLALSSRSYMHSIDQDEASDDTTDSPRKRGSKHGSDIPRKLVLQTMSSSPRKRGMMVLSPRTPLPKISLSPRKTPRRLDFAEDGDMGPVTTSLFSGFSQRSLGSKTGFLPPVPKKSPHSSSPKGSRVWHPTIPDALSVDTSFTDKSVTIAEDFSPCDISHITEGDDDFILTVPTVSSQETERAPFSDITSRVSRQAQR